MTAADVHLRCVQARDLPRFYAHHVETRPIAEETSPDDGAAKKADFIARWERMLRESEVLARTILWKGSVAGYVAHFVRLETPEIAYWLGRDFWGQGIATQAIRCFLPLVSQRPLYARVADDNHASLRVLGKTGFAAIGENTVFSDWHRREIREVVLALH